MTVQALLERQEALYLCLLLLASCYAATAIVA